jgi:hypothetical protein
MYTCPVCGYHELQSPPENFTICPSCYTEFGYDDATLSHEELRREWIQNGMRWEASNILPPPPLWNAIEQLRRVGFMDYDEDGEDSHTEVSAVILGSTQTIMRTGASAVNRTSRIWAVGLRIINVAGFEVAPT